MRLPLLIDLKRFSHYTFSKCRAEIIYKHITVELPQDSQTKRLSRNLTF